MAADKARKSDRGHQIYRLKDGTRVPGCTTITGVMDKPALVKWANNLGLQGIDSSKYVDALANAGTLAHYLAEEMIAGEEADQSYLDEFSAVDHDRAETSLIKFLDWMKEHEIEVLGRELQLVSEKHRFGGTCDIYARIDGVPTLVDIKTCKALYGAADEKWSQLAGYHLLLEENGYEVAEDYILRIGRSEDEGFEYARMPNLQGHIARFLICRDLYDLNNKLKAA
ncbi:MAG: hypothetical protein WC683_07785 [bacterium]